MNQNQKLRAGSHCDMCGGLIMENDGPIWYAGKICNCSMKLPRGSESVKQFGWICPKCENSVAPHSDACPSCKELRVD